VARIEPNLVRVLAKKKNEYSAYHICVLANYDQRCLGYNHHVVRLPDSPDSEMEYISGVEALGPPIQVAAPKSSNEIGVFYKQKYQTSTLFSDNEESLSAPPDSDDDNGNYDDEDEDEDEDDDNHSDDNGWVDGAHGGNDSDNNGGNEKGDD
jgi:hypothetical protein